MCLWVPYYGSRKPAVMRQHDDTAPLQVAPDHDSFLISCTGRQLLSRHADKWVTLVLCALLDGTTRHSVLARRITVVSQKMLTQTLRNLERDGLVSRTVTPTVPLTVEYELTAFGSSLVGCSCSSRPGLISTWTRLPRRGKTTIRDSMVPSRCP
jgi:DNA-binding HxlR family transcriptional regulator